ncbi:MAG: DUF6390 family protein [Candidatus Micrarchaeota archaeon]
MKGIGLAARYSFPPNSRNYCGTESFKTALKSSLAAESRGSRLERELRCFHPHYAYLKLIASENGMEPFEMEVVRAFWTGNSLLENVSLDAMERFIEHDLLPADPKRAKVLAKGLPDGLLPHHSFNPLYVNFVTRKVDPSMANLDACCVTWAEVLSVTGRFADVLRFSVAWEGRLLMRPRLEAIELERKGVRSLGDVKSGDWVSVHWGMAIEKLGPKDRSLLERYTRINMAALNIAGWKPPHSDAGSIERWRH